MKSGITKDKTTDRIDRLGLYIGGILLGRIIGFLLTFRAIPESDRKLVSVGNILLEIVIISGSLFLVAVIAAVIRRKLLRKDLSDDKSVA